MFLTHFHRFFMERGTFGELSGEAVWTRILEKPELNLVLPIGDPWLS